MPFPAHPHCWRESATFLASLLPIAKKKMDVSVEIPSTGPRKEITRCFSSGALLGSIFLHQHLWVIQGNFSLHRHNAWALRHALMAISLLNPNSVVSNCVGSVSLQVLPGFMKPVLTPQVGLATTRYAGGIHCHEQSLHHCLPCLFVEFDTTFFFAYLFLCPNIGFSLITLSERKISFRCLMWGNAAYTCHLLTCCPFLMDVSAVISRHFARSSIWLLATVFRHYICSFELPSVYIMPLTCHYLPLAFSTAVHLVGSFQRQPLSFQ